MDTLAATTTRSGGRKPVIGLVGGIGSGKSTVAALLAELGAAVIDSDKLNDLQLLDPEVIRTLVEWWGESVLTFDGSVDRAALAKIVFSNPDQRLRMETLLHPRIAEHRRRLMTEFENDRRSNLLVINSPLLFESGLDRLCNAVVFIQADREVRLERVVRIRGWTAEDLDRRERIQKPLDFKRAIADYVVDNNTCLDRLRVQVRDIYSKLLSHGSINPSMSQTD